MVDERAGLGIIVGLIRSSVPDPKFVARCALSGEPRIRMTSQPCDEERESEETGRENAADLSEPEPCESISVSD
jgi:hypothetical protein